MKKLKTIIPNTENLPIKEYWDNLPKRNGLRETLLKKVSKATCRETGSVRRWFLGTSQPPTDKLKKVIADLLSCTTEALFPILPEKLD